MTPWAVRTHQEMQDVLMAAGAPGPEIHYYMIRGGESQTNITVWQPGSVGGEYIKTYGHYHVGHRPETYTVLQGEGIIILQERATSSTGEEIDDQIINFRALKVKAGDKINIPENYGHLAINIGPTWFVTSDDSPVNFSEAAAVSAPGHADYTPFKKLHGAAYYVVLGNDRPELVKNPHYQVVPEARIE